MRLYTLVFSFLISFFVSQAQTETQFKEYVNELCSPRMHGRGASFHGDSIAAFYVDSVFKQIGLQPLPQGTKQTFLHDVLCFEGQNSLKIGKETLKVGVDFIPKANTLPGSGKLKLHPDTLPIDYDKIMNYALVKTGQSELGFLDESFPLVIYPKGKLVQPISTKQSKSTSVEIIDSIRLKRNAKVRYHIETTFLKNHKAYNVFGQVKGNSDSTIIVCGHYDHIGHLDSETYCAGANDNASGLAMLFSLAEYFTRQKLDKTIVFIAFGAEESGLIGSKFFVENPWIDLKKITQVVNLDLMGSGSDGITVVNALNNVTFMNKIKKANANNLTPSIKERGQAANSDHYYFSKKDIPSVFIYARGSVGGYHDVNDVPEKLESGQFKNLFDLLKKTIEFL